ncbi:MAG: hypothetical protein ABIH21_05220 [Patescibacteria group bacterium]
MKEQTHKEIPNQEIQDTVTSEQKEAIKEIAKLNLGALTRVDILLVALGAIPATEVSVHKWNDSAEKVQQVLEKAGLVCLPQQIKDGLKITASYAVAKEIDIAKRLIGFEANKDHTEYGRLMGYPETAIAAFGKEDKLADIDLYKDDPASRIISFRLSKDHAEKEMVIKRQLADLIEQHAPELYHELVDSQR